MLSLRGDAQGVEQPGQIVEEGLKMLQESTWQRGHHSMAFMWVKRLCCVSNFSPHTSQYNTCRLGSSSLTSFRGDTCLDFTMSGLLMISSWGSSWLLWVFLLCIFTPMSDLKLFPQMAHLNMSSPCFGNPTSGSTSLSRGTGAGFSFFFKKASFRLAFLLSIDGLGFFLILPGVSEARPLSLASREKEKEEPTLREKLKTKPWPASVWQRSRHLAAKEESLSPIAVIFVVHFWTMNYLEGPGNQACSKSFQKTQCQLFVVSLWPPFHFICSLCPLSLASF